MDVRDDRAQGWFQMDNAIVDEYLPKIGHTAFAVYACLVRTSYREQGDRTAAPSYSEMQRILRMGRGQVARSVKVLVDHGLVTITKGTRASNVYHIMGATGSISELVPDRNQCRIGTGTSSRSEPELVPDRNPSPPTPLSLNTRLRQDYPPMGEGEINTPRTHTRARFSPANPLLSETDLAEDAAAVGVTPDEYLTHLPQWADSRLASGRPAADWRPDARKFIRASLQIDRGRASPNGVRGTPFPTKEERREANNAKAWEELDAAVLGKRDGNGLRTNLQAADEPPRRRLPAGDPGDDDGGVLDGLFRER